VDGEPSETQNLILDCPGSKYVSCDCLRSRAPPSPGTISFLQPASPVPYSTGLTTTLTATANWGLPVTYQVHSGSRPSPESTLSYSGPGTVGIEAAQTGNITYAAAAAVQRLIMVTGAPAITFAVANHTCGDAPFSVSATSNSSGAITYSLVSGNATVTSVGLVTLTGAGPVTIQAAQLAAGSYVAGRTPASRHRRRR
jgi:hypothetical protein